MKSSLRFRRAKKSKIHTFSSTDSPRLLIVYMSIDSNATTNRSNSIMRDSRRIVGSIVHAKAVHVTNEAECGRRYGRNKTTKLVQGHVAEVQNGQSATGRSLCFLTCDFDFGEGISKRKKLNIRSVKSGPPPVAVNLDIPAQNPPNSEINAADAIEAATANSNDAGNPTINLNVLTIPAAPSNSNYPTTTTTTSDAALSLPTMPTVAAA